MKIIDVKQGSQEWLQIRAGIPTASQFDQIVTRSGKPSESRERYMLTLLAERLMGRTVIEHVSFWADRGKEEEANAVSFYEFQRDLQTDMVGFVMADNERWGASPDRLVGREGMLEIKVPSEWIHMGYLLKSGKAYDKYKVQCQGQLFVCENCEWTDIMSYHPELPPALIRIERDLEFQDLLATAIPQFADELDMAFAQIQAEGLVTRNAKRWTASPQEQLIQALKDSLNEINK